MTTEDALVTAYVTQQKRAHSNATRGIPAPEQVKAWEADARATINAGKAQAWANGYKEGVKDADAYLMGRTMPNEPNPHEGDNK